jgi:hypothetical protein
VRGGIEHGVSDFFRRARAGSSPSFWSLPLQRPMVWGGRQSNPICPCARRVLYRRIKHDKNDQALPQEKPIHGSPPRLCPCASQISISVTNTWDTQFKRCVLAHTLRGFSLWSFDPSTLGQWSHHDWMAW